MSEILERQGISLEGESGNPATASCRHFSCSGDGPLLNLDQDGDPSCWSVMSFVPSFLSGPPRRCNLLARSSASRDRDTLASLVLCSWSVYKSEMNTVMLI